MMYASFSKRNFIAKHYLKIRMFLITAQKKSRQLAGLDKRFFIIFERLSFTVVLRLISHTVYQARGSLTGQTKNRFSHFA